MKTRINITIEKTVLHKVKLFTSRRQISLSQFIENYLESVVKPVSDKKKNILMMVEELEKPQLDETIDLKKAYHEDRAKKYGFKDFS